MEEEEQGGSVHDNNIMGKAISKALKIIASFFASTWERDDCFCSYCFHIR
jgi:hypothetical protein